jgi:capsular exopolysaccharide synthesis family protein
MDLRLYLDVLRRRVTVIAVAAAVTIGVVAAAGLLITPAYTASTTVRVIQDVGVQDLSIGYVYGEILMNTYDRVLTSGPVLEQAVERLGKPLSVGRLRQQVSVEVIPDTELMRIIVEDQDATLARDLANTLAELLIERAQELYAGNSKSALLIVEEQMEVVEGELKADRQQLAALLAEGALDSEVEALRSQIQFREDAYDRLLNRYELARLNESLRANSIVIVEPATLPRVPSNALGMKEIGIGLVVGLSGGIGLALVLENLDTRIHSPQQVERLTRLPVLGTVPRGLLASNGSNVDGASGAGPIEEAYRLLGINLQTLREDVPLKTILITSAIPKEGKSTTAVNLAQALAERGQTVFLVESDLRRPTIATMLEIQDGDRGLGTLLAERAPLNQDSLSQVIYPAREPSLFVITGGPKMANPTALLASPVMDKLLGYLGAQGQTTLLDAPPVLGAADVSLLASRVDGVLLVVRQAQTKREELLAALKQLQASRASVVGTVFLNRDSKGWSYN